MKLHQNMLLASFLHLCRPEFSLQAYFLLQQPWVAPHVTRNPGCPHQHMRKGFSFPSPPRTAVALPLPQQDLKLFGGFLQPHCLCPFSPTPQHRGHPYTRAEQTPLLSRKEKHLLGFFSPEMSCRVRKPNQEEWPALLPRTSTGFLMFCPLFLASHREERAVCGWAAQGTSSRTSKKCGGVIAVRIYYFMFCMRVPLDQS